MTIFKVYVMNRLTGDLMSEHTLVGNGKEDAAMNLRLTDAETELKKADDLDIVWQQVGEFDKRVIQRVKTE